jgi:hypothetical protein
MYGPTQEGWKRLFLIIAILGGLACVGLDHGCSCVLRHVTVGWK